MNHQKKRLDAVAEILMGQAPPGESYNLEGDGWPLLAGAGDFKGDHPVAKKFTTEASRISIPGDVVIGVRASIGDKVIADQEYCLGRGVAALRARSELHDRYLWHWLSSIKPSLEAKGKGATFKQVTKEDIAELEIPLPPLEEQRRIAAILDKCNAIQAADRKRREILGRFQASHFRHLFGEPSAASENWPLKTVKSCSAAIQTGPFGSGHVPSSGVKPQAGMP
jgi:type I restriction enzyme S subunit